MTLYSIPWLRILPSSPSDASWTVSNDWIVDTGATAHMTPHKHWFVSMVPCKTPIRLADKSIVYSEGKGVVHFAPRDSKLVVAVTDVLYVPLLGCNLFSALHLTQHKEFKMVVTRGKINFMHQGKAVIQATVSESCWNLQRDTQVCGGKMMHLSEDTCPYICLGRCAQTTLHNTVTIKGHWWSHDMSGDLSCDLLSRVGCYKSNTPS